MTKRMETRSAPAHSDGGERVLAQAGGKGRRIGRNVEIGRAPGWSPAPPLIVEPGRIGLPSSCIWTVNLERHK